MAGNSKRTIIHLKVLLELVTDIRLPKVRKSTQSGLSI